MGKKPKTKNLNALTFTEIMLAFAVLTITLSFDIGYADNINIINGSKETLYILNVFAGLAIVVTALGITGIQLIHTYRRTGEIGLRKTVGARGTDIFHLIVYNTLKLLLIPAVCGGVAGLVLLKAVPFENVGLYESTDIRLILASMFMLLVFTLLSGSVPAFAAAKMEPVSALGRSNHLLSSHASKKPGGNGSRITTGIFLFLSVGIIASGIILNHSLEAQEREDILNSTGAPPATTLAAPGFSFRDASGQVISSASLKGRSYCLLIWEVSCSPSVNILNILNDLVKEGKLDSRDIYAISLDKTFSTVKKHMAASNLSIGAYIDYQKSVKWAFKANALPALYIVGDDGIIKARIMGWSDTMKQYLLQKISEE